MFNGQYVFSQIVDFLPRSDFDKIVKKYNGDNGVRHFDCRDQLLAMVFGQLANLNSLRSITLCLNAHHNLLYHLGFKVKDITLSTLSRANENRDHRIFHDLAFTLIAEARQLYLNDNDFKIKLKGAAYALDSTVIDLCLNTFKWARFRTTKSAVKIHTQLDLRGNIPSFILITQAKTHDVNFLDDLEFEAGAFYIMDRGYFDFERLFNIDGQRAYFVVRAKDNLVFKRVRSAKASKNQDICCDQIIKPGTYYSQKYYPEKLRRIKFYDAATGQYYVWLTNNFTLKATIIADLYKHRWQIELFFKWMKQHLHIEVFWGHSENAVKTQICIALITFLLAAIMKKRLNIGRDLYEILQILTVSLFEKTPINIMLNQYTNAEISDAFGKQLNLFTF